jgi:mevalonate kinase
MNAVVSAPGKIHLIGEHSVVYGKPALLAAIQYRLCVQISDKPAQSVLSPVIAECLRIFSQTYHLKNISSPAIEISSDIPQGSGLGSSAALAVAGMGALHVFFRKGWNPDLINKLAYEAEKKQHGNPSGGDNTIVTFGGLLWYRKEFDFLKSMWQIPFSVHKRLQSFYLLSSGKPVETTGEMVDGVRSLYDKDTSHLGALFQDQEELAKEMVLALKHGDELTLMSVMPKAEDNLEEMGVVGNIAQNMIKTIRKSGGVAKISGAGGKKQGSGMLLIYHPKPDRLKDVALANKWDLLPVSIGEEGVRVEKKI